MDTKRKIIIITTLLILIIISTLIIVYNYSINIQLFFLWYFNIDIVLILELLGLLIVILIHLWIFRTLIGFIMILGHSTFILLEWLIKKVEDFLKKW